MTPLVNIIIVINNKLSFYLLDFLLGFVVLLIIISHHFSFSALLWLFRLIVFLATMVCWWRLLKLIVMITMSIKSINLFVVRCKGKRRKMLRKWKSSKKVGRQQRRNWMQAFEAAPIVLENWPKPASSADLKFMVPITHPKSRN